jgi:hypothetical protein
MTQRLELLLATRIFRNYGCSADAVIEVLQSSSYGVLDWLLGARYCELWHEDWEAWIFSEKPMATHCYFEAGRDAEALRSWLDRGAERAADVAANLLREKMATPLEIQKAGLLARRLIGGAVDA